MPDALTAADASARPHAAPPPSAIPAMAGDVAAPKDGPAPTKPAALFRAATGLLPALEAGQALDAATLRRAMSTAFGATDAEGAWVWKDAYEAAEAALVLFLQRYARLMRREAGAGPDGPAAMLAMLETLAALEPSQTRRSEEQMELQQFSTPLPLAYAALQAAAIRPGDTVLEPSAGTGMLAVMAQCALGDRTAGALHLNELAGVRAGLLTRLFPDAPVTRHNAEAIADRLPAIAPSVVLMNPPFSVSPGVNRMRHDADLRHLRSAFSMLPVGGRLAAITSANCIPGDAAWADAFERLDACVVFSTAIDGRAYARRGTTFDTRLTVLDKGGKDRRWHPDRPQTRVTDAAELLAAVAGQVPPRLPVEVAALPTADLFGHKTRATPRKTTAKRPGKAVAKPEPQASRQEGLGSRLRAFLRDRCRQCGRRGRCNPRRCRQARYRPLRSLGAPHRAHRRRQGASDAAGAIRRHGGGLPSRAGLPPDAARMHRGGRHAFRRPARKRDPRRPGPRPPARCPLPHRARLGDRRACGQRGRRQSRR